MEQVIVDNSKTKSLRNTNVEILRFVLMMAICFWHVIVHGYNFKEIGTGDFSYNGNMMLMSFFLALFSPAVYCFMFISGWYGIKFSLKKFCFFAFCGLMCALISLIFRQITGYKDISVSIANLFPIACRKWWFLSDYAMVYLISPFIESGFKLLDKKTIRQVIWLMTYLEVAHLLCLYPNSGSSFYGLLYIYVLARYLRSINFNCPSIKLLCTYAVCLLILSGGVFCATQLPGKASKLSFVILSYNNPLIIVMAISIFLFVNNLKTRYIGWINIILSNVLVIYLLTEAFGSVLYKYEAALFDRSFLQGLLFTVLVSAICLLIGLGLTRAFAIILRLYNIRKS